MATVSGGDGHSLALKSDGTVVAWGWNGYGQTDVPVGLTDVVTIDTRIHHNLALKSDGTVVAWGLNWDPGGNPCLEGGQTDVPAALTDVVDIAAGAFHSLALKSDGTVVGWGDNCDATSWWWQAKHPKVIQERPGHASIKTTLDTYGHLFDGLDEAAADRLDESWRHPGADSMRTRTESKLVQLPRK